MDNPKILIIDKVHTYLQQTLAAEGYKCITNTDISLKELKETIGQYTGLVVRSRFKIDKKLIDGGSRLKFIARLGSGMENIETDYAASREIICLNSPEGNRDSVGEHATGILLALLNKVLISDQQVRHGIWKRLENMGTEIMGKTIGIIGYGNTGSAFARCLKGFDANVIAYDKYKKDFSNEFVKEVSMEEIFRQTDILSLHIPLTDETRYLVNEDYVARFSKNIFLVNTSRGEVVLTRDLVTLLKNGKISGAALDVLEYEKYSFEKLELDKFPGDFQYLINSDRVVLTPHIAGITKESIFKLAKVLTDKILKHFPISRKEHR
ncbi:NAD(P)-dependent oxidoreductase [candidate division KSB1 bacterium]